MDKRAFSYGSHCGRRVAKSDMSCRNAIVRCEQEVRACLGQQHLLARSSHITTSSGVHTFRSALPEGKRTRLRLQSFLDFFVHYLCPGHTHQAQLWLCYGACWL